MLYLDYTAKPINVYGKKIGYQLVPKLRATKPSAAVFEELVKETGMNLPASSLESVFNSIVEATAWRLWGDFLPLNTLKRWSLT